MTIVWNHQSLLNSPAGRHQDPKGNRLILRVSAVKNRVWVWQARVGGVPRQITIGDFPAIGLADARKKAGEISADHALGVDVYVKHGAGAKTAPVVKSSVMTCQEAWDVWIAVLIGGTKAHGSKKNKDSTIYEKQRVWKNTFCEHIGDWPITQVTEEDLLDRIEPFRDDGKFGAANTATRFIKAFFKWAKTNKRATGLKINPAEDFVAAQSGKRTRYLDKDEIRLLWIALEKEGPIWRDGYRLALLSGQRRDEIFEAERSEVNEGDRCLDIRAERMKNNREHRVPLGDMGWAIIQERIKASNSVYLFPSFRDGDIERPVSGFSKAQKRIRDAVAELGKGEGRTVPHWTLHDLRRTFSSHVNGIKDAGENRLVAKDHIERAMSHLIGGVEGTYDRNDYFAEKRRVYRVWEEEVTRITSSKPMVKQHIDKSPQDQG